MLKVKLFGITREIVGSPVMELDVPVSTVGELLSSLKSDYPEMNKLTSLLVAVNSEYANSDSVLKENDEIALIPPVSGG